MYSGKEQCLNFLGTNFGNTAKITEWSWDPDGMVDTPHPNPNPQKDNSYNPGIIFIQVAFRCVILVAFSFLLPTSGNLTSVQTAWERSYATKTTVRALVKQSKIVAIIFDQSKSQERPQYYIFCTLIVLLMSHCLDSFCVCVCIFTFLIIHTREHTLQLRRPGKQSWGENV